MPGVVTAIEMGADIGKLLAIVALSALVALVVGGLATWLLVRTWRNG